MIKKAVIPAAGLGTRMLPEAKAVAKEVMPIVDKPSIHYLVQEAVDAGIDEIFIITNHNKAAIETYFNRAPEYEEKLIKSGKLELLREIQAISEMAKITYIIQDVPKGLGHAVYLAKDYIKDEPFMVLYGDDVILSDVSVSKKMCDIFYEFGKSVLGVNSVSLDEIGRYCSLNASPIRERIYSCCDMVEKPKPHEVMSNLAILGRVLLTPEIFDILENQTPGAGGEIQLTDAMATLARRSGCIAYDFEGLRLDMGSKLGFLQANVLMGLKHPELSDAFKTWLTDLQKTL